MGQIYQYSLGIEALARLSQSKQVAPSSSGLIIAVLTESKGLFLPAPVIIMTYALPTQPSCLSAKGVLVSSGPLFLVKIFLFLVIMEIFVSRVLFANYFFYQNNLEPSNVF